MFTFLLGHLSLLTGELLSVIIAEISLLRPLLAFLVHLFYNSDPHSPILTPPMPPSPLSRKIRSTIRLDPIGWASTCGVNLRPYQREIAHAVKDSIIHKRGLTFVIILPRQSGKNELQSHLFAWLLFRAAPFGGRIVSVSPTFKPQTLNNMDRVRHSLDACLGSRGRWEPSSGYMFRLGKARLQFFSGESTASVVGATADLLLSVDEAQDIDPAKFDKDFDPMTASSNATRLFWGTAWTSSTLLERQRRIALEAEKKDGIRRLFFYTADHVRRLVPSYATTLTVSFLKRVGTILSSAPSTSARPWMPSPACSIHPASP